MAIDAATLATIAAIVVGPVIAVAITRASDNRRARRERRMEVFRTLMRTRRNQMSGDHVGALNLIEIEFGEEPDVMSAWRTLLDHFAQQHARRPEEAISDEMSLEEVFARQERFDRRLLDERQSRLAKLLHAMAKSLDFEIEQLEIFEGGYTPQGWVDDDAEQRNARRYLNDLANARKVVPVTIIPMPPPQDAASPEATKTEVPDRAGKGSSDAP